LWVALISPFTIKESITSSVKIGMLVALLGGGIVAVSDSCVWSATILKCPGLSTFLNGKAFLGDLLALCGSLMGASYLLIGRSLRHKMSLIHYVFVVYGMAAVVLVGFVLVARLPAFDYPAQAYVWFLLLALLPQLLGHSSFNWALRYISAGYVSTALLGDPIASTILAYFLLGEAPGILKIFGAILILAGIYMAARSEK
jgi:drug/metabolite transporter (DMT)-like permease